MSHEDDKFLKPSTRTLQHFSRMCNIFPKLNQFMATNINIAQKNLGFFKIKCFNRVLKHFAKK